jgi:hypothetical protein
MTDRSPTAITPSDIRTGLASNYSFNLDCAKAAARCTSEQRKEFIAMMWAGKTLGEAYKQLGITFEAALGIMNDNIREAKYLNRPEEVT